MRRGMGRGWRIIQWLMAESWEKEKRRKAMKLKNVKNLIAQVEFGHNLKVGSCLSCYMTNEAQSKSIREASEVEKLSEKLEKILNEIGIYNIGNRIEFKWVKVNPRGDPKLLGKAEKEVQQQYET